MGFSYEVSRDGKQRLCCDRCDHAGGVRRIRCPHGYCQSTALCEACRKNPAVRADLRAYHEEHCREAATEWAARQERSRQLLASGASLRSSAINEAGVEGPLHVRVTFRNASGRTFDVLMSSERYASVPLMQPATMADYGLREALS